MAFHQDDVHWRHVLHIEGVVFGQTAVLHIPLAVIDQFFTEGHA